MTKTTSKSRVKKSVTIDGTKYESRSAAAKALVASGKSIKETAELTGITYATVFSITKGAENTKTRQAKYRIIRLGQSGKKSAGEIANRVGISTIQVVNLLKAENIEIVKKEKKKTTKKVENKKANKKAKKTEPVVEPANTENAAKAAAMEDMQSENMQNA